MFQAAGRYSSHAQDSASSLGWPFNKSAGQFLEVPYSQSSTRSLGYRLENDSRSIFIMITLYENLKHFDISMTNQKLNLTNIIIPNELYLNLESFKSPHCDRQEGLHEPAFSKLPHLCGPPESRRSPSSAWVPSGQGKQPQLQPWLSRRPLSRPVLSIHRDHCVRGQHRGRGGKNGRKWRWFGPVG